MQKRVRRDQRPELAKPSDAPPSDGVRWAMATAIMVLSAIFLFWNLGHYALWDDEAETALGAKGVLLTGDTSAVIGHNIQARRSGINLKDLHDRLTPPLPTFLVAGSMKVFGENAFAVRLPFALLGLAAVGLAVRWLWRSGAATRMWVLVGMGILGNVSLFLYFRQGRYYGAALFFGVLLLYLYANWRDTRRHAALFSIAGGLLFMCHPISFAQFTACVAADAVLFGRGHRIWSLKTLPFTVVPMAAIVIGTLQKWNPFAVKAREYMEAMTFGDRVTLFFWYLRDIHAAEFTVAGLLVLAAAAYFLTRNAWLLRGLLAVLLVVLVTAAISYQSLRVTTVADIRYAVLAIPLGIGLGALALRELLPKNAAVCAVVGALAFGTNLINGAFIGTTALRATPMLFAGELRSPPPEPYTPTAAWIREHVKPRETVWAIPDHMMYPLMFHAPEPVYVWQIQGEAKGDPQFAKLDRIHFQGEVMPDYIIAFGPVIRDVAGLLDGSAKQGQRYEIEAKLPVFYRDLYRPELFWRQFKPVTGFHPDLEVIYILKRQR